MKKIERLRRQINDSFRDHLHDAMKEKGVEVKTEFNIWSGNLVTRTVNGKRMTAKQMEFMKGFEAGYLAAMKQVPIDG